MPVRLTPLSDATNSRWTYGKHPRLSPEVRLWKVGSLNCRNLFFGVNGLRRAFPSGGGCLASRTPLFSGLILGWTHIQHGWNSGGDCLSLQRKLSMVWLGPAHIWFIMNQLVKSSPLLVPMIHVLENWEGVRMEWEFTGTGKQWDTAPEPAVSLKIMVTLWSSWILNITV